MLSWMSIVKKKIKEFIANWIDSHFTKSETAKFTLEKREGFTYIKPISLR